MFVFYCIKSKKKPFKYFIQLGYIKSDANMQQLFIKLQFHRFFIDEIYNVCSFDCVSKKTFFNLLFN